MNVLFFVSGWLFAFYYRWEKRTARHPRRWAIGLFSALLFFTFLPGFVGIWGLVFWPLGWLFIPVFLAAEKQVRRKTEANDKQLAMLGKTQKALKYWRKGTKR